MRAKLFEGRQLTCSLERLPAGPTVRGPSKCIPPDLRDETPLSLRRLSMSRIALLVRPAGVLRLPARPRRPPRHQRIRLGVRSARGPAELHGRGADAGKESDLGAPHHTRHARRRSQGGCPSLPGVWEVPWNRLTQYPTPGLRGVASISLRVGGRHPGGSSGPTVRS